MSQEKDFLQWAGGRSAPRPSIMPSLGGHQRVPSVKIELAGSSRPEREFGPNQVSMKLLAGKAEKGSNSGVAMPNHSRPLLVKPG